MPEEKKKNRPPRAPWINIFGWIMFAAFSITLSTVIIAFFIGDNPEEHQFWRGFFPLFLPPALSTLFFRLDRGIHKLLLNLYFATTLILTLYFAAEEGFTPESRKIVYGALIGIFIGNWVARQINAARQGS